MWLVQLSANCALEQLEVCGARYIPSGRHFEMPLLDFPQDHRSLGSLQLYTYNRPHAAILSLEASQMHLQGVAISNNRVYRGGPICSFRGAQ